jgi:hypothetical protein
MTPDQVVRLGWDIKLPLSLDEALNALEIAIQSHVLDDF